MIRFLIALTACITTCGTAGAQLVAVPGDSIQTLPTGPVSPTTATAPASRPAGNMPVPSEPAVVNGLEIKLTPMKMSFSKGEPIALRVIFRNVSGRAFGLNNLNVQESWIYVFTGSDGKVWTGLARKSILANRGQRKPLVLPAGRQSRFVFSLDEGFRFVPQTQAGEFPKPGDDVEAHPNALPVGTYDMVMIIDSTNAKLPQWSGKMETKPVKIEITVATAQATTSPVKSPESAGSGEWTPLFKDQKWYKDHKAQEQVFEGTLEDIPGAGGPSSVMRTSYYRLGTRTIYTAGRTVDSLDELVGKKVILRGKTYDINLSGQSISEIWPAEIRQAQ